MAPDSTDLPPEGNEERPDPHTPETDGTSLDQRTLDAMLSADLGRADSPIQDELLTEDRLTDDRPVVPPPANTEHDPNEPLRESAASSADGPPADAAPRDANASGKADVMTQAELDAMVEAQMAANLEGDNFDAMVAEAQAAVLAEDTPPAAAAPPEEPPLTQADLDQLVADADDDVGPGEADTDAALSQEAIEALIAAKVEGRDADAPQADSSEQAAGKMDETLSQEALDALLAGETAGGEISGGQAADDDVALSQDALDALIAGGASAPEAAGPASADDNAALSQEALDALIAGGAAEPAASASSAEASDDAALSQDDLDALIAGGAAEPATPTPPAEASDDTALSQDDLDALIAGGVAESTPSAPPAEAGDDAVLSQDDLDAIIAGGVSDETAAPAPEEDGEALSQTAIDALLSGAAAQPQGPTGAEAPPPESAGDEDSPLDQSSIDALLAGGGDEAPLAGKEEEPPVAPAAGEDDALSQTSIDALISGLGMGDSESAEAPAAEGDDEISQDMVDAIIGGSGGAAVGAENLAAAGTTPDADASPLLSQADLDAIMEQAKTDQGRREAQRRKAIEAALAGARPTTARETPPPSPAAPSALNVFLAEHALRLVTSLAAALIVGFGTFAGLWLNTERIPDFSMVRVAVADELELAMERARAHMNAGEFGAAAEALKGPIARATPSPRRDDARYLELEARCRGLRYRTSGVEIPDLLSAIDRVVESASHHPRAPEALYWKAQLYEQDGLPRAASDVYEQIISYYPDMPRLDDVLMDASRLAMQLGEPLEAARYASTLISNFPGSRHYSEARLAYGDANEMAGSYEDARTLYLRVARSERNSSVGAEAFLRLGELAYRQRNYADAAMQLETRLSTATTSEGNDKVYLLLAQAYRKLDRLEDARHALNDLLSFYPNSPEAPKAFIELSQVQDDMGDGEAALATANRAAVTYPGDPLVLRNKGELLGRHGHPFSAAMALMDADACGAADPAVLLMAARLFRVAEMRSDARTAYEKLADDYGDTGQALTGNIELAQMIYEGGGVGEAVDRLEDLAQATLGGPKRLDALLALVEMYRDLGLDERVAELSHEISDKADQPEDLALAATALLAAGDVDGGMEALKRVDLARVKDRTAYRLLNQAGTSLMSLDPRQSLRYLEDAYLAYPRSRTLDDDQRLLTAYLQNNRVADARRMVVELKGHVDQSPADAPYLIDAAIALGDHQFGRGAYRTAADTYAMAIEASDLEGRTAQGLSADPRWAVFQRANALLELSDFQGSLPLYAQIENSDAPWAAEAGAKAEYARLQQKIRGGGSNVG